VSILTNIDNWKLDLYDWGRKNAEGTHAKFWLAVVAFSESSFFLLPPDVLLVAILIAGAKRWWYWAGLTTFWSVLGGIAGYFIGAVVFDVVGMSLISFYGLTEELAQVQSLFDSNTFLVIFLSAFTPLPYKVFTISAGILSVNFLVFILASILGRALRYFSVAYVVHVFDEYILKIVLRYFNIISLLIIVGLLLIVFL